MSSDSECKLKNLIPTSSYMKLESLYIMDNVKDGKEFKKDTIYYKKNKTLIDAFIENKKEIIWINIKIDHDGYDKYGPESNLVSCFLITKEDDKYHYYMYHYEDWFDGYNEEYELYSHDLLE